IHAVLESHAPEQVAVEQVFIAANPSSALKLGHARGAAITAAVIAELPVFEYTPRAVKLALVGTGAAEKEQVLHMIRLLLGTRKRMSLDESDALAVALCHAHTNINAKKLRGLP
ncbi:MAG TPA: crossover junction endodeoxyribonuclease RuvC, partial [Thiolapillus brandeum]|nr:crossover junction endodeoxyribonuclease RuvC [Thiolapillus brandeum]